MKENEIPIGLAMSLALNEFALEYYSTLDEHTRKNIKNYVQDCTTGEQAKQKIEKVIKNLENNNIDFLR